MALAPATFNAMIFVSILILETPIQNDMQIQRTQKYILLVFTMQTIDVLMHIMYTDERLT